MKFINGRDRFSRMVWKGTLESDIGKPLWSMKICFLFRGIHTLEIIKSFDGCNMRLDRLR